MLTWPAGRPLVRVHNSAYGATEAHPGPSDVGGTLWAHSRFAHFRASGRHRWVPTLYAGQDDVAAMSETVFHTVAAHRPDPSDGERQPTAILARPYLPHLISSIAARRDLRLIDLTPTGLERLGWIEAEVTTSASLGYDVTVALARGLYLEGPPADGLVWNSRQRSDRLAVALWAAPTRRAPTTRGAGVRREDLEVVTVPQPLLAGSGMQRLLEVANALGITVVPPEVETD